MIYLVRCKKCKAEFWCRGNPFGNTGVEITASRYIGDECSCFNEGEDFDVIGEDTDSNE